MKGTTTLILEASRWQSSQHSSFLTFVPVSESRSNTTGNSTNSSQTKVPTTDDVIGGNPPLVL